MAAKLTPAAFFTKVQALHPTLDFSQSEYLGSMKPLTFICPTHGEQTVRAGEVSQGIGCPKCGRVRAAEKNLLPKIKSLTPEQKAEMAARARAGRTKESNEKIAESQRQRWATDEAGKAAQSARAKKLAAEKWANTTPEERKAKMAAVRAAKQQPNGN